MKTNIFTKGIISLQIEKITIEKRGRRYIMVKMESYMGKDQHRLNLVIQPLSTGSDDNGNRTSRSGEYISCTHTKFIFLVQKFLIYFFFIILCTFSLLDLIRSFKFSHIKQFKYLHFRAYNLIFFSALEILAGEVF